MKQYDKEYYSELKYIRQSIKNIICPLFRCWVYAG